MQKKKKNIYYKKQQKPQTNKQKSPPKQTHQQCIYTLCSNMYKNQTQVNASFDGYNHYGLKFLSIITVFRLNNRIKNNHRFSPGLRSLESSSTYLPPKIFYLRNPPDQSYRSLSIRINHAALEIIYLKDVYKLNKARESEKPVNTIISRDYVITEKVSCIT